MKSMKVVLLALILSGCGSAPTSPSDNCATVDDCTHASVAGYKCQAETIPSEDATLRGIPAEAFKGLSCITISIDYQTDPSCDPQNPNGTCTSWGADPYPCCETIQGPGSKLPITK